MRIINATGKMLYCRIVSLLIGQGYEPANTNWSKRHWKPEAQKAVAWWNGLDGTRKLTIGPNYLMMEMPPAEAIAAMLDDKKAQAKP